MNRGRNPLRGSQVTANAILKENSYSSKYKLILKNLIPNPRESRAFMNITNLYKPQEEPRKGQRLRNSRPANVSFRSSNNPASRQTNATVVLPELIPKQTKPAVSIRGNPQECEEYVEEIDKHLLSIEGRHRIEADYMDKQEDINTSMRAILVDWLVDVHVKFKLRSETLFLTVNIIDRYLQKEQVNKDSLQLVGVTAAFISSKYEEIYPPEIKDFVYITDFAYTKEQLLSTEQKILCALGFNLNATSSNRFLQRFTRLSDFPKKAIFLAQYLVELSLIESGMLVYTPSTLAASAICLSNKLCCEEYKEIKGFPKESLNKCMKNMVTMLQEAPNGSLQAVRRKFSTVKFMEVAQIKISKRS
eukprot:TRINITY_DN10590_c0_g4_i2.p1 TRINITY_DN10590_c0_g4~~TRINITY_DN10590_c0_g4_i2.p1  ORF type:complete len:384 (-),score=108.69 TRINITY_DN10590_c0_g4_i2:59-1141(-)